MRKLNSILICVACTLALSGVAHGELIRTIDFEDGSTGSAANHPHLNPSGNAPEIVSSQNGVSPRSGSYMMKSYLNRETSSTNYRTEVTVNSPSEFYKGQEYWISISVFLPADWRMDYGNKNSDGMVWQLHDRAYKDPNWRKLLPLTVMHTQDGWVIRNHTFPTSGINQSKGMGNLKPFSKTVPYNLGQWTDFVINFKLSGAQSKDDTNGFIKVWVNGKLELDHTGQNYFGEQTYGPYFKFGLYNSAWKYTESWIGPSSRVLYHDEFRIGDANSSYEEIAPSGTPKPPTGGGSGAATPPAPPTNLRIN